MIYLDTHAVIWLHEGCIERFTPSGRERLEQEDIFVSPAVQLELQFLKEIGKIIADPSLVLESLRATVGLVVCDRSFAEVVVESLQHGWTRDPFDRLIVGQAATRNAPLLTKDRAILENYARACW